MRTAFLFIAIVWNCFGVAAQNGNQASQLRELTIGQQLPDIRIDNIINSKKTVASTSDFKGKLLILDFWATWCTPCVALMPKMDSLQRAFDQQIQILPVTYQQEKEIKKYLEKLPSFKNLSLPMATGDNVLRTLFPHKYLPHYVWIDGSGKVIAITGLKEVTETNIRAVLNSNTAGQFAVKKDKIVPYNREKPMLFQPLGIEADEIVFQSLLTGYQDGLSSRLDVLRDDANKIKRVSFSNSTLSSLFRLAWSDTSRYFERTMMAIEVADKQKFTSGKSGDSLKEWRKTNSWCYELIVPESMRNDVFAILRSDMGRFFPQYALTVEKRTVRCLVLEKTSKEENFRAAGGKPAHSFTSAGATIRNCVIGLLRGQFSYYLQHLKMPIVDATGYEGRVDMDLEGNLTNVAGIRKALQPYNVDLVEKDYEIDMLIIRDRK